ncbi:Os05g0105800 [Oryza sativa Japonica Group]|uniref:Os05g0105800 protein n=1 Tax=Oryza sativa subsp. japonica TaxID=39947 RepID=Q65XI4_ORYSJ|nr:unknown protein [Oryza sativa Japonica Group]BAH92895.1 Os05g0105800 [Oryza sativa Japonica Group]|eukprot:NP_001174167.1 Os05g0105800 [Oryza sativa Japonica Group]
MATYSRDGSASIAKGLGSRAVLAVARKGSHRSREVKDRTN